MSAPGSRIDLRSIRPVSLALLLIASVALGYLSGFPDGFGPLVAAAGVAVAAGLRTSRSLTVAAYAPLPVLAVLVLEVLRAPLGLGIELVCGIGGLAFLVWLADDPCRPAGGGLRGLSTVAVPALAVGIAWSSALFLPAGAVPLGVAGGLLALTLALVAYLVGRPSLFDREEA